jgi:ergothioneine biosynthesis protein EgtB
MLTAPSRRDCDVARVKVRAAPAVAHDDRLAARYARVRALSLALAAPLSAEDAMVQSMPDASPAKWHLAHTTWFFEQFVLPEGAADPRWARLFNSYYHSVGPLHARPRRGLLSRPSLDEVLAYRAAVDDRVARALRCGALDAAARARLELGLQHEQQHQELLLTDIQHALWCNPLRPAYCGDLPGIASPASPLRWQRFDEAVVEVGAARWTADDAGGASAFAFDNESPRHRALVPAFALAQRPVSNAEYRAFVEDGGYRSANLWLSEGWALVEGEGWSRPLYWDEDLAHAFTLAGTRTLDPQAPACHLSYYEADAFARWAGARLPTEFEWERAAGDVTPGAADNFVETGLLQPRGSDAPGLRQLFGDVWEWTASAYAAYPGFRPWPGALGEYNGKFMCNQFVLRGGSCASPREHLRASYRNFFGPAARWQFAGLRLAKDGA